MEQLGGPGAQGTRVGHPYWPGAALHSGLAGRGAFGKPGAGTRVGAAVQRAGVEVCWDKRASLPDMSSSRGPVGQHVTVRGRARVEQG